MEWNEVLIYIIESVIGLIVSVGIPYGLSLLSKKIKDDKLQKYLNRAENVISNCVLMIKQTFVDSLKAEGKFDKAAQSEAFERCKTQILELLNEEAKAAVVSAYGDLETYIKTAIERNVAVTKF